MCTRHSLRALRHACPDQPYCLNKYFLAGTLGDCDSAAIELVNAPERGIGVAGGWKAHQFCESIPVLSCDPTTDPVGKNYVSAEVIPVAPSLCSGWDFFAGEAPDVIRLLPGGSEAEWRIFETGNQTRADEGA